MYIQATKYSITRNPALRLYVSAHSTAEILTLWLQPIAGRHTAAALPYTLQRTWLGDVHICAISVIENMAFQGPHLPVRSLMRKQAPPRERKKVALHLASIRVQAFETGCSASGMLA